MEQVSRDKWKMVRKGIPGKGTHVSRGREWGRERRELRAWNLKQGQRQTGRQGHGQAGKGLCGHN